MSITAIVENNVIKLPVNVPDGTTVQVTLPEPAARQPEASTPRVSGLTAGAWKMADDFTDELPDGFWLGHE